jgi:hypothetical protein
MIRLPILARHEFMERALCAEVGGDMWFAEKHQWRTVIEAKLVCQLPGD